MTLRFYNTLTRRKQEFQPQSPDQITMYVCGVTVYDYCHLGHARAYVVWDMVRRYLQYRFADTHQVKYVQNITDIDDKILKRSKEQGITMQALAEIYINAYNEDMAKLNIIPSDRYPQATEFVPQMIDLIQELVNQGYAYACGGDVYYAVQKFPEYGKLAGRKLAEMQAGASGRVDDSEQKRYPLDFALWKSAKPNEPYWSSPWGRGRPGWHIECSAMVKACLGESIDIHAGGADLQFPHHENEIAQSEALTQQPLASFWLHNGFVNIDGEKMSKSLNNFKTIRALLAVYEPMAIRLFILQSHYRQPIDFTEEAISSATTAWQTFQGAMQLNCFYPQWQNLDIQQNLMPEVVAQFQSAMDDDCNTSVAIATIYELAKKLKAEHNNLTHGGKASTPDTILRQMWATLQYLLAVLGFDITSKPISPQVPSIDQVLIEQLIADRLTARKAKNYQESDRLRDQLKTMGVTLIDQPDGTTRWLIHRS